MNFQMIEGITETEIDKITADISRVISERLHAYAAYKQEVALVSEVQLSGKADKERVWEYLRRTEGQRSSNRHLSRFLRISARRLKQIRDELVAEGKIRISKVARSIRLEVASQ